MFFCLLVCLIVFQDFTCVGVKTFLMVSDSRGDLCHFIYIYIYIFVKISTPTSTEVQPTPPPPSGGNIMTASTWAPQKWNGGIQAGACGQSLFPVNIKISSTSREPRRGRPLFSAASTIMKEWRAGGSGGGGGSPALPRSGLRGPRAQPPHRRRLAANTNTF